MTTRVEDVPNATKVIYCTDCGNRFSVQMPPAGQTAHKTCPHCQHDYELASHTA